jgi:AcrR family transcriptional regulator
MSHRRTIGTPIPRNAEDFADSRFRTRTRRLLMPRVGLTTDRLVEAAAELADEVGFGHVSISALARRFGVKDANLYSHVRNITFHGYCLLEAGGGFGAPRDVRASWDKAIDALHAALTHWPREASDRRG